MHLMDILHKSIFREGVHCPSRKKNATIIALRVLENVYHIKNLFSQLSMGNETSTFKMEKLIMIPQQRRKNIY